MLLSFYASMTHVLLVFLLNKGLSLLVPLSYFSVLMKRQYICVQQSDNLAYSLLPLTVTWRNMRYLVCKTLQD